MLSIAGINSILIEQDPEGLIKMGAPIDEYSWEAEKIYNRIMTENKINIIDYTSAVVFVFYEDFGSFSDESGNYDYNLNYLNKERIDQFKTIGTLILQLNQNEIG